MARSVLGEHLIRATGRARATLRRQHAPVMMGGVVRTAAWRAQEAPPAPATFTANVSSPTPRANATPTPRVATGLAPRVACAIQSGGALGVDNNALLPTTLNVADMASAATQWCARATSHPPLASGAAVTAVTAPSGTTEATAR